MVIVNSYVSHYQRVDPLVMKLDSIWFHCQVQRAQDDFPNVWTMLYLLPCLTATLNSRAINGSISCFSPFKVTQWPMVLKIGYTSFSDEPKCHVVGSVFHQSPFPFNTIKPFMEGFLNIPFISHWFPDIITAMRQKLTVVPLHRSCSALRCSWAALEALTAGLKGYSWAKLESHCSSMDGAFQTPNLPMEKQTYFYIWWDRYAMGIPGIPLYSYLYI